MIPIETTNGRGYSSACCRDFACTYALREQRVPLCAPVRCLRVYLVTQTLIRRVTVFFHALAGDHVSVMTTGRKISKVCGVSTAVHNIATSSQHSHALKN